MDTIYTKGVKFMREGSFIIIIKKYIMVSSLRQLLTIHFLEGRSRFKICPEDFEHKDIKTNEIYTNVSKTIRVKSRE